ncbi:hypothetical protein B4O97_03480 [Marispirochaeta aestuarii]|uniref:Phage tail protein n=1 Tax=Marispirochaeta aestuarii TaxID=1963862 RepID=A0A1Y1S2V8_9SPIO|nr:hypothetical protein [Marispirochaeta aestuarii]ORC37264.1 hypothetical protein B4O97_03480 [Marispirochaeta aestuarii]
MKSGDIRECSINNRLFDVVTGSDVTFRTSGYQNETEATGNGGIHVTQRRKLGGFDGLPVLLDHDRGDLEFLQAAADSGDKVPCYLTLVDGTTYRGDLVIVDVLDANTGTGQVEITASGPKFEQI